MPNQYGSLAAGQYTNADVMAELDRAGPYMRQSQGYTANVDHHGADVGFPEDAYRGSYSQTTVEYGQQAAGSGMYSTDGKVGYMPPLPPNYSMYGTQAAGGAQYAMGATQQFASGSFQQNPFVTQGAAAVQQAMGATQYASTSFQHNPFAGSTQVASGAQQAASVAQYANGSMQYAQGGMQQQFAGGAQVASGAQFAGTTQMAGAAQMAAATTDPYGPGGILEGAVDVYSTGERRLMQESVVDARQQIISGVRPIYTFEKVVEVPQVVVREYEREVIKPQLIERIIEVPKTEIVEKEVVGPPTVQVKEQIVEIPQVHIEERVIHVPRREVQERLIEIPKIEYVERIEYEDFVEYREVPVDKIVEVPEIEYHIREVEHLVPQTYIQEYYIDRYAEVPVTQVQEVQRREEVPMGGTPETMQAAQQYMQTQAQAMAQMAAASGSQGYNSQLYGAPFDGSRAYSSDYSFSQQCAGASYADYDPNKPAVSSYNGYGSMAGYGASYGNGGYNPMEETAKDAIQATIASLPVGSIMAVPKGTIRQGGGGSLMGSMASLGSMQAVPGYPPMPPPTSHVQYGSMGPADNMPSTQSGMPDYGPFGSSRPPVPAY